MTANEVGAMIGEAMRAMGIGVSGVFLVLAVFYVTLKALMAKTNSESSESE